MKNKTVFDVNIWLSYFIKGKTEKILEMIRNNDVFFYRSEKLMSELKEVINRQNSPNISPMALKTIFCL